eukprot:5881152-Pleurochrysis_carterae.AAC.2
MLALQCFWPLRVCERAGWPTRRSRRSSRACAPRAPTPSSSSGRRACARARAAVERATVERSPGATPRTWLTLREPGSASSSLFCMHRHQRMPRRAQVSAQVCYELAQCYQKQNEGEQVTLHPDP